MSKIYINNHQEFFYGDKPDDTQTREATVEEINNHILATTKASKLSDIATQNILRKISDSRRAELETQIKNSTTLEELESIAIN